MQYPSDRYRSLEDYRRELPRGEITSLAKKKILTLTEAQTRHCRCGSAFSSDAPDGEKRFYAPDGSFLALGTVENGRARTIKSFFEVDR